MDLIAIVTAVSCALIGVLLFFTLRAAWVERREGLSVSWPRVGGVSVAAVGAIGVIVAGALTGAFSPASAPAPAPALDEATQHRVDELTQQIARLQDQVDELRPPPSMLASVPPAWPAWAMLVLVIIATSSMAAFGRTSTLLPSWLRRRLKPPAEASAPTLLQGAFAADQKRWGEVLRIGERVPQDELDGLEMLDFLYLRAVASYALATEGRDGKALDHQERGEKLERAATDLERLLDRAPNMAEAKYLRARVRAARDKWEEALPELREAGAELGAEVPFARHDLSVALLQTAQQRLGKADVEGSTALFDEVARIGVLGAEVPRLLFMHRFRKVREHAQARRFDEARTELAQLAELSDDSESDIKLTISVYEVVLSHWEGKRQKTLELVRAFLAEHLPNDLPAVDESVADEYLEGAVDKSKLPLPAELFRKLLFLEAATLLALSVQPGRPLDPSVVDQIAKLLMRALSLSPRDPDCLAALGVLYYWFKSDMRTKATEWMQAAVTMGVQSPRLRRLVQDVKQRESERLGLLDRFRDTASRFLMDATVADQVRAALVEELGRFSDFRPVLLALETSLPTKGEMSAPTIEHLRERSSYLSSAVSDMARRNPQEKGLRDVADRYAGALRGLEQTAKQLGELEQNALETMGKAVLR